MTPLGAATSFPPKSLLRPAITRRHASSLGHIVLGPLVPIHDEGPVGYIGRLERHSGDPDKELSTISWTLQALEVLNPDAFLAAPISPDTVATASFAAILAPRRQRFVPVLEAARVGRRMAEVGETLRRLHELGFQAAVSGHRISSVGGFDALVVTPRTAAVEFEANAGTLIVIDVASAPDLDWASSRGAALIEGPAVADPIRVAPVDLSRLQR